SLLGVRNAGRPGSAESRLARAVWYLRSGVRGELHRQVLDAADEVGSQPLDGAVDIDVREAAEQFFVHHLQLQPREPGAEAEVLADAKGKMLIRAARDVEGVGIREDVGVPVHARVPHDNALTLLDNLAADL